MCAGVRPDRSALEAVGDHLRLPCLSVPRGPADMGREHDVGHARERMVGGQPFADEVIQARGADLAAAQRVDERVGVVQLCPSGVEEHYAVAHRRELRRRRSSPRCRP